MNILRIIYKILLLLGILWAIGQGIKNGNSTLLVFGLIVSYPCGHYIIMGGR